MTSRYHSKRDGLDLARLPKHNLLPADAQQMLIDASTERNPKTRLFAIDTATTLIRLKYPNLFKEQHHGN